MFDSLFKGAISIAFIVAGLMLTVIMISNFLPPCVSIGGYGAIMGYFQNAVDWIFELATSQRWLNYWVDIEIIFKLVVWNLRVFLLLFAWKLSAALLRIIKTWKKA